MTKTEMLERLRHLTTAVSIPVLCDADTGFGGVINVDAVYIQSVDTAEDLAAVRKGVSGPLVAVTGPHHHPPLTRDDFQELGYSLVCPPLDALLCAAYAVDELVGTLLAEGTTRRLFGRMVGFKEFNDLMDLPKVYETEARYSSVSH